MEEAVRHALEMDLQDSFVIRFNLDQMEEWRSIDVPGYRCSIHPKAWRWVSSLGRLLSNDLTVKEAEPRCGRQLTSVATHHEGCLGSFQTINLHRIVAYTFLGPPPTPHHTVDHVNRDPSDNRVANLRWATPTEQMLNRTFRKHVFHLPDQGIVLTGIQNLAEATGVGVATARSRVHTLRGGDVVVMGDTTVVVVHHEETPARLWVDEVSSCGPTTSKAHGDRCHMKVFETFVSGGRVEEMADALHIKRRSLISYLHRACRESPRESLARMASRLYLSDASTLQTVWDTIVQTRKEMADHKAVVENVEPQEYDDAFRSAILGVLPECGEEWDVVRATIGVLVLQLL